jgi:hypothetical protein
MRIRDAVPGDAASLTEIASAVRLRALPDASQQRQGFLIDVSLEHYQYFIANDLVLAVEDGSGRLAGFSIILGPRTMAETGIRERAESVQGGTLRFEELDPEACAYWEQLAFLPRREKGVAPVYLAFASMQRAFGIYEHLFGAVAAGPTPNLAPRRLLSFAGWQIVGSIHEDYAGLGRVHYDIYHMSRARFRDLLAEPFVMTLAKRLRDHAVVTGVDT